MHPLFSCTLLHRLTDTSPFLRRFLLVCCPSLSVIPSHVNFLSFSSSSLSRLELQLRL